VVRQLLKPAGIRHQRPCVYRKLKLGRSGDVDVVTYGPGLHMLRADTSPVQDRIKSLEDSAFPSKIQFSACNNTKEGMEKKEGHPINVLSEAVLVPSGVVRLMEVQEKGWSYVRP
jgi:uncharacterized protein